MADSSDKVEDDVLGELNADFQRSKAELIQRFLLDQEELNKRFEEYTLTPTVESVAKDLPRSHSVERDLDQLSTCSTIHGSDATLSDREDFEQRLSPTKAEASNDISKEYGRSRKSKKVLKKKMVRPKTAMESRPFLERVRQNLVGQNDQLKSAPNRHSHAAHPLNPLSPQRSSTSWNPNQFQTGLTHIEERFSVLTELNMGGRPLTSSSSPVRPASQASFNQRKSQKIQVLKLPPLDTSMTGAPSRVSRGTKNSPLHSTEFIVGEGF